MNPLIAKLAVEVLIALTLFVSGLMAGMHHVQGEFDLYKDQIKIAQQEQELKAKQIEEGYELQQRESRDGYEKKLAANTDAWAKRLLQLKTAPSGSSAVPQATTAASGVAQAPADPLPDYPKLIMDCQATTVQCEALQDFERKVTR